MTWVSFSPHLGGLLCGRNLLFVYSCLQWDLGIWSYVVGSVYRNLAFCVEWVADVLGSITPVCQITDQLLCGAQGPVFGVSEVDLALLKLSEVSKPRADFL